MVPVFSEFELNLISQRTVEGQEHAKSQGKRISKPVDKCTTDRVKAAKIKV
jgi:DNA invertase Pin-like site-specific DNA recombinase